MGDNRLTRDSATRETTQRKASWKQPNLLPTPAPQDGYGFRWIRTSLMGKADPTNISAKFREHWVPVKAEDHPEMMIYADPQSRFKDNIEVAGLLLCKMPEEFIGQRSAYYAKANQDNMDAVDNNFMRESDARMPLFREKKSSSSFGQGR